MSGTQHNAHPAPSDRDEFLVDDCPRCGEYVRLNGRPFDPVRFRAFWAKMVEVEWESTGSYASKLDRDLGERLYLVALNLEAAFGMDPRHMLAHFALTPDGLASALGLDFGPD